MGILDKFRKQQSQPAPTPAPTSSPDTPRWLARNEAERPAWMVDGMNATLMEADKPDEIALVGESFYQEALWMAVASNYDRGERVRHPVVVVLYPEPNNPHDRNAISGWIGGLKVGHFSREDAAAFRASVEALMAENGQPIALHGVIAGGGQRSDGPGNLGVWLYYPPERLVRTTG